MSSHAVFARPEKAPSRRFSNLSLSVGNTPLTFLSDPFVPGGGGFWAKLEGFNPGGIKDRPALHMLRQARARGDLKPGATVIESTSGTLGLGLALAGIVFGHPVVLVTDPGMEPLMCRLLASYGVRLETVTEPSPVGGWQQARRDRVRHLLGESPGAYCPDQYNNPDNVDAYAGLAHELLNQLPQIDTLVCSVGTGGHSAGISSVLRRHFPGLRLAGVDTVGSTIFGQPARPRLMRGLGSSIHPRNVDHDAFDEIHWVAPAEAVWACRTLAALHYVSGGWSTGAVALVARWLARTQPGRTIVAIFPDGPWRYWDSVYDDEYCLAHGLLGAVPADEPDLLRVPDEREVHRWTRCPGVRAPLAAGLAAWTIGLVLGLRNLSQQGLFLIGGTLADRLGHKPLIMLGCALRTVGFALFGLTTSLPWLIVAAAVTGFAGALFNPAARAYLACEAGERKVAAFAVFNVFYQGGILLGPLVGIALLNAGFTAVCLSAAGIFAVLTVLQGLCLPPRRGPAPEHPPVLSDWRRAFGDRAFVSFAAAMIASYALSYQMYLALPLEVERVGGGESGVMALYALSALLGIAGQVRVTAWCAARWSRGRAISRGLALMGIAFLPPALAAGHLPPGWALLPLVACTLLLTLGTLAAFPFEMATIADMAGERLVGTYYGVYNLLSGIGILAGNLLAGALVDAGRATGAAGLPWALLAAAGLLSAAAVSRLDRRQRLPAAGQVATA